jgi:hypothetical protein
VREDDVDWDGVLAAADTMSGGGQVLVRLAYRLWTSEGVVGIWELPRRLARPNFERVLTALKHCRSDSIAERVEVRPHAA